MSNSRFIAQKRREFRRVERVDDTPDVVTRLAVKHSDLIKHNILDGCCSTTSIFDDECGDVPSVFDPTKSRLDLADELMRAGASRRAQKVASEGVQVDTE